MEALIHGITDPSADVRAEAWKNAGLVGAPGIVPLGEHIASEGPGIAKAARAALENIVYYAGRPGAGSERAEVAVALVELLDGAYPLKTQREALHFLSFAAGNKEVPAIAPLLSDEELAEDARLALERIPRNGAIKALVNAMETAPPELCALIMTSLAQKNAVSAIPAIQERIQAGNEDLKWAGLDALARLGALPNQAFPVDASFSEADHTRYTDAFLRAAEVRVTRGDTASAERIYTSVSSFHATPYQAGAALAGLARIRSGKLGQHALGHLGDPELRSVVKQILAEANVPGLEEHLVKAYPLTNPGKRADILQILVARHAPGVEPLLEEAGNDDALVVRFVARTLAGGEISEEDLLAVAQTGMPWNRDPALEQYLDRARARQVSGDTYGARVMFEEVAGADFPSRYRISALQGLEQITDPGSLKLTQSLMTDPELGVAAGRAYVGILVAQADQPQAQEGLFAVAEQSQSLEVVSLATDHLDSLGADTSSIPQRHGFITDWSVLGPFPNVEGSAFQRSFAPEEELDDGMEVEYEGKQYEWQNVTSHRVPAIVDLRARFDRNENVAAYAYAEISTDKPMPVAFLIGSDDGCEFWLNGEKLFELNRARSLTVDGDRVKATLKLGFNRVLLKILQGTNEWEYCVRVTKRNGEPLDLSRQRFVYDPVVIRFRQRGVLGPGPGGAVILPPKDEE